jgi:hypothetical protein
MPHRDAAATNLILFFSHLWSKNKFKVLHYVPISQYPRVQNKKTKENSVVSVRKRTIPTEQPLLVGQVSANFCAF